LVAAQTEGGQAGIGSAFSEGERLLRENKPSEAATLLEKAVLDPAVDERAWLYLGTCYELLGRYDDAVTALRKGSQVATRYKPQFFYDMGNAFVLQGKNAFAEEMYGQAITANPSFAKAWLNRANVRVSQKNFEGASADYGNYLGLEPNTPQRANIEALLRLMGSELAAAHEAQAQEDARLQAAAQAKKALLDEVQASLKAAAEETTNLSAGSGQVQGYADSLDLDQ
jgi:tetratricopeptide (TPR) repeat protein